MLDVDSRAHQVFLESIRGMHLITKFCSKDNFKFCEVVLTLIKLFAQGDCEAADDSRVRLKFNKHNSVIREVNRII